MLLLVLKPAYVRLALVRALSGNAPLSRTKTFLTSDLSVTRTLRPKRIPDSNTLAFGQVTSDHMFEAFWRLDRGWSAPHISPYHALAIDPAAKVLHYSTEVFEGMKAYYGRDGKIRLFRPMENVKRLLSSSERSTLPTFDAEEMRKSLHAFVSVERDWIPRAEGCALYIRPTFIATEPSLGVSSSAEALLYIIACPVGPYFPTGMKPISLLADPKYVRSWPGGGGNAKMGSNYGPTILIQKQALAQGCQQVLWLFGDDHSLTEAGTMNVFVMLKNDMGELELVTPPLNDGLILPGVTRKSILELANSWGEFKVSERKITMKEVGKAQKENRLLEIFGAGTACVVCPIEKLLYEGKTMLVPTMASKMPVFQRLYDELNDIYYGKTESKWTEVVA